jgi:hypothetical protein
MDTDKKNQTFLDDMPDMEIITRDIRHIRSSAERLHQLGNRFPALSKNAGRILASLKMIELSIQDADISSNPITR